MGLGSFLRSERKLKGYTQEDAAKAAGVVVPVVSKWENERSVPDLAAVCALCRLLDLRIDEFIGMRRNADLPRVLPPKVFDPRILGETCKKLRIKNGLSQSEAGARLYVTSQTVSKWENGGIMLLDTFAKLAEFYNISPVELLCGTASAQAASLPQKKRTVRIVAVVLCAVLAAGLLLGGLFIGKYVRGRQNTAIAIPGDADNAGNGDTGDGGSVADPPATPKEYVTVTYHFPDGTTEAHTLKAGVKTYVEPSYTSRDTEYFQYKGYENGVSRLFDSGPLYNVVFNCDMDLYPEYHTSWVDFSDAKTQHDRELFYNVERLLGNIEAAFGSSFNTLFEVAVSNVENEDCQGSVFAYVGREEFDRVYSAFADGCARLCDTVKDAEYFTWAAERIQTLLSLADRLKTDMLQYLISARFPFESDEYCALSDAERIALHLPIMEYVLHNFGARYLQLGCVLYDFDDAFQCTQKSICVWYNRYAEHLGKEKVDGVLGI